MKNIEVNKLIENIKNDKFNIDKQLLENVKSIGIDIMSETLSGAVLILENENCGINTPKLNIIEQYLKKDIAVFIEKKWRPNLENSGFKNNNKIIYLNDGTENAVSEFIVTFLNSAAVLFDASRREVFLNSDFIKDRMKAFVNVFGKIMKENYNYIDILSDFGFSVIMSSENDCLEKENIKENVYICKQDIIQESIEHANIRIIIKDMQLPVDFANTYEGEWISEQETAYEYSYRNNRTCELVRNIEAEYIKDHRIIINDDGFKDENIIRKPIAILVDVYGRNMENDFEQVIEKDINQWVNYIDGASHSGRRDRIGLCISKKGYAKGVDLKTVAQVIYSMIKNEYYMIVDRCQITITTNEEQVKDIYNNIAKSVYEKRDFHESSLTDENVDEFYTCTRCQSIAPYHCCIVTPERAGMCGSLSYLGAKATKSIYDLGPCQPIEKQGCNDVETGSYESINSRVETLTLGALKEVDLYSILSYPMTSCYRMECITTVFPEVNGVIVVGNDYLGDTPLGMSFMDMIDIIGGGDQVSGFMGHNRKYITSDKFIKAEGGHCRIVWMSKNLKDDIGKELNDIVMKKYGIDNFTDKICDEETGCDIQTVISYIKEKEHPVLKMEELIR